MEPWSCTLAKNHGRLNLCVAAPFPLVLSTLGTRCSTETGGAVPGWKTLPQYGSWTCLEVPPLPQMPSQDLCCGPVKLDLYTLQSTMANWSCQTCWISAVFVREAKNLFQVVHSSAIHFPTCENPNVSYQTSVHQDIRHIRNIFCRGINFNGSCRFAIP